MSIYNNEGNKVKVFVPTKSKGLVVKPSTPNDKIECEKLFEREGFYAEYNEEFNEFELEEQNIDALEFELGRLFNRNQISVSFSSF